MPTCVCANPDCSITFHRPPSYIAARTNCFCSRECHIAWRTGRYLVDDSELKRRYRTGKRNGKYVSEHGLVAQQILGRPLLPDEVVHHLDGNGLNNDPSNLVVLNRGAHTVEHLKLAIDIERAKALFADGLSCPKIAKELGVSRNTVDKNLKTAGLGSDIAKDKPRTWNLNRALRLIGEGHSPTWVERKIGATKDTVASYLRRYPDLDPRRHPGATPIRYNIRTPNWDIDTALQLIANGHSISATEHIMGITKNCIFVFLRRRR